ncbi:hypothetical protein GQ53DRAFT_749822 [Thozetella sp. PMI_491]|nr:hypothetical protein GQ53DRAFT_749822 [Thozetella sp. PMI_491]
MTSAAPKRPLGPVAQALVEFSVNGAFPEETVSSLVVGPEELPPAIEALAQAKRKLEAEIHTINEETADDVRTWQANAQSVQDDIIRSKALANEILKESEAPAVSGKDIEDIEGKAAFLIQELNYNQQVHEALKGVKKVNQLLDQVEKARDERRILEALHLLEKSWTELDSISVSRSCRAIRLLDIRAFELKNEVHEVFDHVWNALVCVDVEAGKVSISESRPDEPMSLADAVIGLKAYKEVDQRAQKLWRDIDLAIFAPRMDISSDTLPRVNINKNTIETSGSADKTAKSLFADLKQVFGFLVQHLPSDLIDTIASVMMPEIIVKITTVWLDAAVPSSLHEMEGFEEVIAEARGFYDALEGLKLSGLGDLREWVSNAPTVWVAKCRQAALDSVRTQLSQGLGTPKQIERIEKQMVSKSEGMELATTGATASADDHGWDAAWSDDGNQGEAELEPDKAGDDPATGEDDGADAWGWGEEEATEEKLEGKPEEAQVAGKADEEEDPSEAWGWGDDGGAEDDPQVDATPTPAVPKAVTTSRAVPQTKEMTLKETYNISSMPEPVLALIFAILEDGAALTQDSYANSPVVSAVAGLFSLPTLALAMFRAISPYYYSFDMGGNMYLYNDAMYLSERLAEFSSTWKKREDLSTRAQNMLRMDNDVKSLHSFANRAYSNEMNIQKTVLRDLLGGEQNLMQQDETESCVESAVARVRAMAITWQSILPRSAWYQAVGSLVDAVSAKIVGDVMDMSSIGQEEAYNIARYIATVTELDDLFLPSRVHGRAQEPGGEEIPMTAQYAASWLRLKYLSEVLQSNLKDVRYLWMESELGLYFTATEIIDLINLSFEDNTRTREVIREITQNPRPIEQEGDGW